MGDVEDIKKLFDRLGVNGSLTLDDHCLHVIAPPTADKFRDELLGDAAMPATEEWRLNSGTYPKLSCSGGIWLDVKQHIVRANHFKVSSHKIPTLLFHYSVAIHKMYASGELEKEDTAVSGERRITTQVMKTLYDSKPMWRPPAVGITYDGAASLFSTQLLFPGAEGEKQIEKVVFPGSQYLVTLTFVSRLEKPSTDWHPVRHQPLLQALDTALLSFARWEAADAVPTWLLAGVKVFRSDGDVMRLSDSCVSMLGYYASLKICRAGLVFVADIAVNCFLAGGSLLELMCGVGNYNSLDMLCNESTRYFQQAEEAVNSRRSDHYGDNSSSSSKRRSMGADEAFGDLNYGLPVQVIRRMEEAFKTAKIKVTYCNQWKKLKSFGPAPRSASSGFTLDGRQVTIEEYYEIKYRQDIASAKGKLGTGYFATALGATGGKLLYPTLPTVNVGSVKKPAYIPAEFIIIPAGQTRTRGLSGDMSAKIIKQAAMLPNDRMKVISTTQHKSLLEAMTDDPNAEAFGLGQNISHTPLAVRAQVLYPAKLCYGNKQIVEPKLAGTWNLAGSVKFSHPAPDPNVTAQPRPVYLYSVVMTFDRREPRNWESLVYGFVEQVERESFNVGIPLSRVGPLPMMIDGNARGATDESLAEAMGNAKRLGARAVLVLLNFDCYSAVKLAADSVGLPSQCIKWKNMERLPKGYLTNVLMKINCKMGGINHTLAERIPSKNGPQPEEDAEPTFQQPPRSLSWLLDDLCMVVGVDVTHPEPQPVGSTKPIGPSILAIVASMDGMLGQYCAHITTCDMRTEPVNSLRDGIGALLDHFARKNGGFPKSIIVYRDGVADNQFPEVLEKELPAFKEAMNLRGYPDDAVNVAIVVCQKRHHTRLFYENNANGNSSSGDRKEFMNPCVGLCVDARGDSQGGQVDVSIVHPFINEFYLNSHVAIQGTAKPCKYSLIYDEIGFKMSELELMTYWLTYLYCRCTKSVSYATPAYYAHWAARRGKVLLNAGVTGPQLNAMSNDWLGEEALPGMYFI